ncbi:MAG: ABC transporter ATP-binding protein [Pseudomonadota bacterium]
MTDTPIVFDNVSKSYPLYHHLTGGIKNFVFHLPGALRSLNTTRRQILENVSFSVSRGETFGIIGRNGAGKSTTLGLIAGVIRPSAGVVHVSDRVSPLLELGAGFHSELTGRENIELNGVLLGLSRKEVRRHQDSIVEFSELIDQPIRTYSTGQLARLAFSVVVHLDPKILLIDEILAVGDLGFQKKCMDKMMSFKKQGVTMVYVSHSMNDVVFLCDRVIWIEDRCVKRMGPAAYVAEAYTDLIKG